MSEIETVPTENDIIESAAAAISVETTDIESVSEVLDVPDFNTDDLDALLSESVLGLDDVASTPIETGEAVVSQDISESQAENSNELDNLLDSMMSGVELDHEPVETNDAAASLDAPSETTESNTLDDNAEIDPDLVLVKNLIAELSEPIADAPEAADVEALAAQNVSAPVTEQDNDADSVLDDLLEETIASEEELQEALVETSAQSEEKTSLSDLASRIESDDLEKNEEAMAVRLASSGAMGAGPLVSLLGGGSDKDISVDSLADDEPETIDEILEAVEVGVSSDQRGNSDTDEVLSDLLEGLSDDEGLTAENETIVPQENVIDEVAALEVVQPTENLNENQAPISEKEGDDMATKKAKSTLISEVTEDATSSAFAELTSAVEEKNIVETRGDRIGDIVKAALEPMLKEWLDKNLKTIVERTVKAEIKRISSGK